MIIYILDHILLSCSKALNIGLHFHWEVKKTPYIKSLVLHLNHIFLDFSSWPGVFLNWKEYMFKIMWHMPDHIGHVATWLSTTQNMVYMHSESQQKFRTYILCTNLELTVEFKCSDSLRITIVSYIITHRILLRKLNQVLMINDSPSNAVDSSRYLSVFKEITFGKAPGWISVEVLNKKFV